MRRFGRKAALVFLCLIAVATASLTAGVSTEGANGITVTVDPSGSYTVSVPDTDWQFEGTTARPLANLHNEAGTDAIGAYQEISFDYTVDSPRQASIRNYVNQPVVLFRVTYLGPATNSEPFPTFSSYPKNLSSMTFAGGFAVPSFGGYGTDSPWVFFDSAANAFIVSAASNFMIANTAWGANQEIATGISPQIASLPQGFSHSTLLVVASGINHTFDRWGNALTTLQGKTRPAYDADLSLRSLGYWTDAGATYYYATAPGLTYVDTLKGVKSDFDQQGIALGYLQLDSWFYAKGANADWKDGTGGIYNYSAAPALFGPSLKAFQQQLGVPLITHARWIDASSPYRRKYQISGNVATDTTYWTDIANYLKAAGVMGYEQDWLSLNAQPNFNLTDPDAFMNNMAAATAAAGLSMQYCMASPRHFLQSSKYNNLTSIRTGEDRFDRVRWTKLLYSNRLASALGIWPFADVFMSRETDNLLLATLAAGPVGVGDPIGALDKTNLLRAVRPDGVIVKPDVPITPIDASIIDAGRFVTRPMIAATYTDFGDLRPYYVFAYTQNSDVMASFNPSALGFDTTAYVYSYFQRTGKLVGPRDDFTDQLIDGRAYYIVAPVGPSGIAFLGDRDQFVSLGRKRITDLIDDGNVRATIAFAPGETARVVHGYAPFRPVAEGLKGSLGPMTYDTTTQIFTVAVQPAKDGTAVIGIMRCAREWGRPSHSLSCGSSGPVDDRVDGRAR